MKLGTLTFRAKFTYGCIGWGKKNDPPMGCVQGALILPFGAPTGLYIPLCSNRHTVFQPADYLQCSLLHYVVFKGMKSLYPITKHALLMFAQWMSYCTEMRLIPLFVVTSHMHFHY